MNFQDITAYTKKILDELTSYQKQGYGDFSVKQVNQLNPKTQKVEESLLVDMVKDDETKSVFYHVDPVDNAVTASEITEAPVKAQPAEQATLNG